MTLAEDFEDFIKLLNEHEVAYMVVGGYALGFHGKPRYTGDFDIWVNISEDNAQKLVNVISEFGMASLGFQKDDFLEPGYISQIGFPPLRIDILTSIDGVEFKDAFPNREILKVDDLQISYIGMHDLLKNKLASGRAQDLLDVKEIKKVLPNPKASSRKRKGRRL